MEYRFGIFLVYKIEIASLLITKEICKPIVLLPTKLSPIGFRFEKSCIIWLCSSSEGVVGTRELDKTTMQ
jgi:hypothetical protein